LVQTLHLCGDHSYLKSELL